MQWPRVASLPPRPPVRNPQRPLSVFDINGITPSEHNIAPQGVPTAARYPVSVFILDATPFADCTASTVIALMGYDPLLDVAHPYLIGFGAGAGRAFNLQGWTVNDSEAVARGRLVTQINATRAQFLNARERFPFRAYEIPEWNNSEFTAIAIEREWPSIGGGNEYPVTGPGITGAQTLAPLRVLGRTWYPGARAQECIPARIGPQPAFVPFNVEPRGPDAEPPDGANTIVIE